MGSEVLFLLLPLAALSGWLIARRGESRRQQRLCRKMTDGYFAGLNHLLTDREDEAIEEFLKLCHADSETVEIHFALANLFRRRGEVERAIHIHQNLIARPALQRHQHNRALLELAHDYFKAGLFDRAESLLLDIGDEPRLKAESLKQLQKIYQQEHEWERAIQIATLRLKDNPAAALPLSHYYCEQALSDLQKAERRLALVALNTAVKVAPGSVRATLLLGEVYQQSQDYAAAVAAYERVEHQDRELLTEIVSPLCRCYELMASAHSQPSLLDKLTVYLKGLLERQPQPALAVAIAQYRFPLAVQSQVHQLLEQFFLNTPSLHGVRFLIERWIEQSGRVTPPTSLQRLQWVVNKISESGNIYLCHHCGFEAKTLYWLCPGCKQWSTIKPYVR
ncbi:MAG: lipopolysaccharide assembly protein LapB [Gammaproteobacteria bacterium]|nr:lipopolysaccharide assembly protein LapB [Gammaproteobacteria bacterium]